MSYVQIEPNPRIAKALERLHRLYADGGEVHPTLFAETCSEIGRGVTSYAMAFLLDVLERERYIKDDRLAELCERRENLRAGNGFRTARQIQEDMIRSLTEPN